MKQIKAKYMLGLTATPVRRDGHHPIIYVDSAIPMLARIFDKRMPGYNALGYSIDSDHVL